MPLKSPTNFKRCKMPLESATNFKRTPTLCTPKKAMEKVHSSIDGSAPAPIILLSPRSGPALAHYAPSYLPNPLHLSSLAISLHPISPCLTLPGPLLCLLSLAGRPGNEHGTGTGTGGQQHLIATEEQHCLLAEG
jgi:hypothetical protein